MFLLIIYIVIALGFSFVETRKVGKWEHKHFSCLLHVPIYCFGQNTAK
jgi:hypothetical protein